MSPYNNPRVTCLATKYDPNVRGDINSVVATL